MSAGSRNCAQGREITVSNPELQGEVGEAEGGAALCLPGARSWVSRARSSAGAAFDNIHTHRGFGSPDEKQG